MNGYVLVYPGGEVSDIDPAVGTNGGMMKRPSPAPKDSRAAPNAFVGIIGVDDPDTIMEKVVTAGGRIDMPLEDVPGVGRLGYLRDSEMNMVGIIKPTMEGMG